MDTKRIRELIDRRERMEEASSVIHNFFHTGQSEKLPEGTCEHIKDIFKQIEVLLEMNRADIKETIDALPF